ncbi:MAG: ATP-binding protein [Phascolarctobacterium sp.]|nr:ATP-binding protein [Phascolarctobacterium sp.]
MKESRILEFKSNISNTFLKTVSAFANYNEGRIMFGINDDGSVCGIENLQQACLDIENKINDSITPRPDYGFELDNDNKVISLIVKEGLDKPYLYKGKAYKRNDTATIEVDRGELNRLTLIGTGKYFDQLLAAKQNLRFSTLERNFQMKLGIKSISQDILKTLNLYASDRHYNNAAELLADENQFSGIDFARFGVNNDIILDREQFIGISVLRQFEEAMLTYRRYYVIEKIVGSERVVQELVPAKAFREAIANALIHRTWDINANIRISMYGDRIEIVSPGGLPMGVSPNEYLHGYVSVLRNPILANIFFRLGIVETFGTGVRRIQEAYKGKTTSPSFELSDNAVVVVLPVLVANEKLSEDEEMLLSLIKTYRSLNSNELMEYSSFSKAKVIRTINALIAKGVVIKTGNSRSTRYRCNM